jgi:hypothetical protein
VLVSTAPLVASSLWGSLRKWSDLAAGGAGAVHVQQPAVHAACVELVLAGQRGLVLSLSEGHSVLFHMEGCMGSYRDYTAVHDKLLSSPAHLAGQPAHAVVGLV